MLLSDNRTIDGAMDLARCDGIPSPAAKSNVAGTRAERLHSIGKY